MPVNMFKFKQTLVRKSKVTSTKGFTSPSKPAKASKPVEPTGEVETISKPTVDDDDDDDGDSVFDAGDERFGAFGDMQDGIGEDCENDSDIEEISLGDDQSDEDSEFSERTVDEEEYELYMNSTNTHKIGDFEEWKNSEHFPQHLFDSDEEYDEVTVDSVEFHESLREGGMVVDWTGTRITLDSYNTDAKEEKKKKKKKKKKTTKIKVKKTKKTKQSGSKSAPPSDKKKRRKSERRSKLTKTNSSSAGSKGSFNSSEKPKRKALKEKPKRESAKMRFNGEDSSKDSSLLSHGNTSLLSQETSNLLSPGTKKRSPKLRPNGPSSKASLTGGNDSISVLELEGVTTPSTSPVGSRAARKRPSTKRFGEPNRALSDGQPRKSNLQKELGGHSSDDLSSMDKSSFEIPGSMRISKSNSDGSSEFTLSPKRPKGSRRSLTTGSMDHVTKSPGSPWSPRSRASPLGRRGGRKSASKPQLWADGIAALRKPDLGRGVSTGTDAADPRRSNSRRQFTQSPKRRRSSVEHDATASPIPRRSNSNAANTVKSPIPRRSNSNISTTSPIPRRSHSSVSASPIPRRSNSSRRMPKSAKRQDIENGSGHSTSSNVVRRKSSNGRRSMQQRQRTSSLGELETKGGRIAAAASEDNLGESSHSTYSKPERPKSAKLLLIERMAREGADQHRSNSVSALEKRKEQHAALLEKLAKAGEDESKRDLKEKYFAGAEGMQPRRSSSLDAAKKRRGKSDDGSIASTSTGLSNGEAKSRRSSSPCVAASRRRVRPGSKKTALGAAQVTSSESLTSLEDLKKSFDPFGVADDMRNEDAMFAGVSDASFDSNVFKKPKKRDSLVTSNHGKGPVSLMSPVKSPAGRKNSQQPRRRSIGLKRTQSHDPSGAPPSTADTSISSKDITW
ncbi:MAG: hypothetical protein SGBAC_007218 [Bacillariaceae sp.]